MEVTPLLRVGLGSAVGHIPQYSHPVCMTTKFEHSLNKSMIPGDQWECQKWDFHEQGKSSVWEISQ